MPVNTSSGLKTSSANITQQGSKLYSLNLIPASAASSLIVYDSDQTATAQISTVVCVADSSGSLNNKYFFVWSAADATKYYVWFNVNSAGTDPAVAGATGVEVDLSTNASANTVAGAVASALDALADFVSSASTATVTITNAANGHSSPTANGSGLTSFTYATTTFGSDPTTGVVLMKMLATASGASVGVEFNQPVQARLGIYAAVSGSGAGYTISYIL